MNRCRYTVPLKINTHPLVDYYFHTLSLHDCQGNISHTLIDEQIGQSVCGVRCTRTLKNFIVEFDKKVQRIVAAIKG